MLSQQRRARIFIKILLGFLVLGAGLLAPLTDFDVFAANDNPSSYRVILFPQLVIHERLAPDGLAGQKLVLDKPVGQRVARQFRRQLSPEREFVTRVSRFRQIYRELQPAAKPSFLVVVDRVLQDVDYYPTDSLLFPAEDRFDRFYPSR